MARTLYDVLGVSPATPPAQVHRAYLAKARVLHPDRWIDASDRERGDAARRMQEVNEAWRILGDDARRQEYDRSLRTFAGEGAGAGGDEESGYGEPPPEFVLRLVRALPWVVLLAVLAAIFVFTAYAGAPE